MERATRLAPRRRRAEVGAEAIVNALPGAIFAVDRTGAFRFVNQAAEQFFDASASALLGTALTDFIPPDNPLLTLIEQARLTESSMSQRGVALESPRIGSHQVSIMAAPVAESPGWIAVSLLERAIGAALDQQLTNRGAARSMNAMAAMLAHEIKNPLSGIRGAAQLLEQGAQPADVELTRLICDEADRIVALVDRMEMFSDQLPLQRQAVNIHEVLERVRRIAENGFARGRRIVEDYDPSLPLVDGNRDLLVQVFLNLVKNAAEATAEGEGTITLSTRYQQGVRLLVPGRDARVHLPLLVAVQDNGSGIPEALQEQLFDPFITTKADGKGLGLALVSRIVNEHGGVVAFTSELRRTVFKVMLPMMPSTARAEEPPL